MNSIIWKGVSSTTIKGLIISELPPISKPEMRVVETFVDGVDGSIIEDLGYNPYDKPLTIGLHGDYDINEVMRYFTGEGDVVFSNEPDKVYHAKIHAQIDYNRLLRYRQATILFRTQPYKHAFNEETSHTQIGTASGTSIVVNDSANAYFKEFKVYGKTTQDGTPTPDAPVDLIPIGIEGNINATINEMNLSITIPITNGMHGIPVTDETLATYTDAEGKMWYADEIDLKRGVYIKRVESVFFNGSDNEKWATNETNSGKYRVCTTILTGKMLGVPNTTNAVLMCDSYATRTANQTYLNTEGISVNPDGTIYIFDSKYSTGDITKWKYRFSEPFEVRYGLKTPVETPLTEEEIAFLKNLKANEPTTTIANSENAYMSIEYLKLFEVINEGLEISRPIMTITGTGTIEIYVNDEHIFTYSFPEGENQVVIDSEKEDAYFVSVLKNRNMNGMFPVLQPGTNTIKWSGSVDSISIEPRSRWL